jgi:c-di-GMP-binding flagellar brake protein YcgR
MPSTWSMLTINSPVVLRMVHAGAIDFPTHVDDIEPGLIVVTPPTGANAALLASGSREVDLSWVSPRGRYEQRCRIEQPVSGGRPLRQWRLQPLRRPLLIQRRRYVRVLANLDVTIELDGSAVAGSTIDVSEGGFRIRLPRCEIPTSRHAVVHAALGDATVALPGYVVRSHEAADETEAVVAFQPTGTDAEALRRFVLHRQLRARVEQPE